MRIFYLLYLILTRSTLNLLNPDSNHETFDLVTSFVRLVMTQCLPKRSLRVCSREEIRGRNFYLDWYNYLEDPSQLTEVTEERLEGEEHRDHNYHMRNIIKSNMSI